MKISYAITVCNEFTEIQHLLGFLLENKIQEDEIVVLFDSTNGTKEVEELLDHYTKDNFNWFTWSKYAFDGHFANMKNHLTTMCTGDYIYQIDADEMVDEYVLKVLPQVLEANNVDMLLVPRINLVEGITDNHLNKWQWRRDNNNWINFPDYQNRIYKNNGKIKWKNKVHEVLEGYETISSLPQDKEWCLLHDKTIEKQEKQNELYSSL